MAMCTNCGTCCYGADISSHRCSAVKETVAIWFWLFGYATMFLVGWYFFGPWWTLPGVALMFGLIPIMLKTLPETEVLNGTEKQ